MSGGWKTDISAAPDSLKEELMDSVRIAPKPAAFERRRDPAMLSLRAHVIICASLFAALLLIVPLAGLLHATGLIKDPATYKFRPSRSSAGCLLPSLSRRCR